MIKINILNSGKTSITLGGSSSSGYIWKDTVLTDNWVDSNGGAANPVWNPDTNQWHFSSQEGQGQDSVVLKLSVMGNPMTLYRVYTPGHWEDTDGNWVQGSWGDWQGVDKDFVEYSSTLGWSYDITYESEETNPNANLVVFTDEIREESKVGWRTWNNTVSHT